MWHFNFIKKNILEFPVIIEEHKFEKKVTPPSERMFKRQLPMKRLMLQFLA